MACGYGCLPASRASSDRIPKLINQGVVLGMPYARVVY